MAATYSKPTVIPRWADTGTRTEPSSGKKDAGWTFEEAPPYNYENWLQGITGDWIKWINERFADGASKDELFIKNPGNADDAIKIKAAIIESPYPWEVDLATAAFGASTAAFKGIADSASTGNAGHGLHGVGADAVSNGDGGAGVYGEGGDKNGAFEDGPGVYGVGPAIGVLGLEEGFSFPTGLAGGVVGYGTIGVNGLGGDGTAGPGFQGVTGTGGDGDTNQNGGYGVYGNGGAGNGTGNGGPGVYGVGGPGGGSGLEGYGVHARGGSTNSRAAIYCEPRNGAPSGGSAGEIYYDSASNKLYCHNGAGWQALF